MNVKLRLNLNKWTVIIFAWICIGIWQTFYDHFAVLSDISAGTGDNYQFSTQLIFNATAGLVGSILGGAFLIFYIEEEYQEKSYGFTLLLVAASFVVIVGFITFLLGVLFVPMLSGHALQSEIGWQAFEDYIKNPVHLKNILLWSLVVCLTQFFIQVNNKFGHGVLIDFIKGTYRKPRKEKRIFMFVDLKSSTTIAEKLGNEKYHELLKDFFRDITNPILYNLGEIYQYVGDEVVISWTFRNGVEEKRCIECFFAMQSSIERRSQKYFEQYGLIPEFKAGMHFGRVTAGEIGVIKREITYSGDVLNTAARIQSKCNELGTNFLTSQSLIDQLKPLKKYHHKSLGKISLKGKENEVELCTIT